MLTAYHDNGLVENKPYNGVFYQKKKKKNLKDQHFTPCTRDL